jgi:hypothetical protein
MAAKRLSPGVYEVNGKRVNAKTPEEAQRMAGGPGKPVPTQKSSTPGQKMGQQNQAPQIPKKLNTTQKGLEAETRVENAQANKNLRLNNPNQQNTFGNRQVTYDEQGYPTVTDTLSPDQQAIVDRDSAISKSGRDIAQYLLENGGLNQQFDPQLTARVGTGDLLADRRAQEQELQGYLGRDLESDYAKRKAALDNEMYNKGIPPNPQNPEYKAQLQALNDDFARQRGDIRAQTLQFGGSEMERGFQMNEQRRANEFQEQLGTRGQRISDVSNLSRLGPGAVLPNFGQFQGTNYDIPNPMDIYAALDQLKSNRVARKAAQQDMNRPQGGGGGGGSSVAPSPFHDGAPPV